MLIEKVVISPQDDGSLDLILHYPQHIKVLTKVTFEPLVHLTAAWFEGVDQETGKLERIYLKLKPSSLEKLFEHSKNKR